MSEQYKRLVDAIVSDDPQVASDEFNSIMANKKEEIETAFKAEIAQDVFDNAGTED